MSTHQDADHIGGLDEVLDSFNVKSCICAEGQTYDAKSLWELPDGRQARESENQDTEGVSLASC